MPWPSKRARASGIRVAVLAAALAFLGGASAASAAPGDADARKGTALAKKGDCVRAVLALEQAELTRHRPSTAVALAGCYVAEGDLVKAAELFHTVADEKPIKSWKRDDVAAQKIAVKKAKEIDARIPVLSFDIAEPYEDLSIEIDGRALKDPSKPRPMVPDKKYKLVARAKGMRVTREDVVLHEGERRVFPLVLEPLVGRKPIVAATPGEGEKKDDKEPEKRPKWVGVRFRGVLLPKFVQRLFVDGGRLMFAPGFGATLDVPVGNIDVSPSLTYMSFHLPDTPFKGLHAADTEWEIDSSTLQALLLEVDLAYVLPLDDAKDWHLRIGGGLGIGWAFAGDLFRSQAYPVNGVAGDPYTYKKCNGPNDPRGTFRYCNTLDGDASHYGQYADADWFSGGLRPTIYPWVVLPEVGLSWRIVPRAAIELDGGLSLTGFVFSGGVKFSL